MKIVTKKIYLSELKEMAKAMFGMMVKAVKPKAWIAGKLGKKLAE